MLKTFRKNNVQNSDSKKSFDIGLSQCKNEFLFSTYRVYRTAINPS